MMFELYDDILSVEDIADALKIGYSQVYKLLRSGSLKGYKEGRDWKIPKYALEDYIRKKVAI